MQEIGILKQAKFYRSMTLHNVKRVTEDLADTQPQGFSNTIRWNVGHILFVQDKLMASALGKESQLPETYAELFAPGTKPSDWKTEAPDLRTLYRALKTQEETLSAELLGKLSETAEKPLRFGEWIEMHTIGEIYNFSLFHEGMHISTVQHMLTSIKE